MKSYWLALGLMMLTNEPLELRMWTLLQMQVINAFNPFLKFVGNYGCWDGVSLEVYVRQIYDKNEEFEQRFFKSYFCVS
jgi:hypothetical protein